jgi:hypothetical protein
MLLALSSDGQIGTTGVVESPKVTPVENPSPFFVRTGYAGGLRDVLIVSPDR